MYPPKDRKVRLGPARKRWGIPAFNTGEQESVAVTTLEAIAVAIAIIVIVKAVLVVGLGLVSTIKRKADG